MDESRKHSVTICNCCRNHCQEVDCFQVVAILRYCHQEHENGDNQRMAKRRVGLAPDKKPYRDYRDRVIGLKI